MLYLILGQTRGQGMLEYALIIALVAVVVITSLMLLGPQVSTIFAPKSAPSFTRSRITCRARPVRLTIHAA
jgi:Flp pilus assembly pilin Flp